MTWTSNPSSACSRRKRSVNGLPLVVLQIIYHHMLLAELPFLMEFVLVERGMRKVTLIATPVVILLLLLRPLSQTWPRHLMKPVCVSMLALVRPLLLVAFIFFLLVFSIHTVMEMLSAIFGWVFRELRLLTCVLVQTSPLFARGKRPLLLVAALCLYMVMVLTLAPLALPRLSPPSVTAPSSTRTLPKPFCVSMFVLRLRRPRLSISTA
ncbi:unnamed protein product [Prorocentrum cordatum]|uniref:Uncharacterized protein n=1 Tax=Prorocentrum cordatum TaxID=2364126 RepID=A0ABN9UH82_9DINO|nr:unnamed protein product [Polarella glacialis]|mmetsp:Transcript_73077/g.190670  ORF Transcript_73077/g.190670 Transcript_73077/m.190670 type:complete len:209 (-) Transcript_73077:920-1546(-)